MRLGRFYHLTVRGKSFVAAAACHPLLHFSIWNPMLRFFFLRGGHLQGGAWSRQTGIRAESEFVAFVHEVMEEYLLEF